VPKPEKTLEIRRSIDSDTVDIKKLHIQAFGEKQGPEVAALVVDLLGDQTAKPFLSLVAVKTKESLGTYFLQKLKSPKPRKLFRPEYLRRLQYSRKFKDKA